MPATARQKAPKASKTQATRTTARKRASKNTKKPKGHVANLELIAAHNTARAAGLPFTYREFARLYFYQWKVKQGDLTEFAGMTQREGIERLGQYNDQLFIELLFEPVPRLVPNKK